MKTKRQDSPDDAGPVVVRDIATGIRTIRLNRPAQANALSPDMIAGLLREVSLAYTDETKLLILSGEGNNFCAGLYRNPTAEPDAGDHVTTAVSIESLLQLLWNAPFVTMAMVEGAAVGAGAELTVVCDYRIVRQTAKFAFPGYRLLGISLGTRRFAQIVGPEKAFDIVLNNRRLDRDAAKSIGLGTHAFDEDETNALIAELTESLQHVQKPSIAHLREALRSGNGERDLSRVAASIGTTTRETRNSQTED
ncbi:MAG: enoyl-CoA hydratase/isomerase family protein [Silicimonas sp.]